METKKFRTDLNCNSCVSKATPFLNAESSIQKWEVDIKDDRKVLTVSGDKIDDEKVRTAVGKSGFKVFEEISAPKPAMTMHHDHHDNALGDENRSFLRTYYPLILIFSYIVVGVGLVEMKSGSFHAMRAMTHFMGGFFLVFSFFKLLNLSGFADAYQTYDIVAKRSRAYAYAYPFIELLLGVAYISGFSPLLTNLVTLVVMGVSSIGVIQSLLKKRAIQCACLGTIFKLPMTKITLFEDLLMAGMAAGSMFVF